jgi:hypothetical protein
VLLYSEHFYALRERAKLEISFWKRGPRRKYRNAIWIVFLHNQVRLRPRHSSGRHLEVPPQLYIILSGWARHTFIEVGHGVWIQRLLFQLIGGGTGRRRRCLGVEVVGILLIRGRRVLLRRLLQMVEKHSHPSAYGSLASSLTVAIFGTL